MYLHKKLSLLVALLAACSDPPEIGTTSSPTVLCYFDCPIYPETGPCEEICDSCPVVDPPPQPEDGFLPQPGQWFGSWTCLDGCSLTAPGVTVSSSVIIVTAGWDEAVWRRDMAPFTVMKAPVDEDGTCWRMEPFEAWPPAPGELGCRSEIEICGTACPEPFPPGDCVIADATWTVFSTGQQQRWQFVGAI